MSPSDKFLPEEIFSCLPQRTNSPREESVSIAQTKDPQQPKQCYNLRVVPAHRPHSKHRPHRPHRVMITPKKRHFLPNSWAFDGDLLTALRKTSMRLHRLRQNRGRPRRPRIRKGPHLYHLNLGTQMFPGPKTGKSQRDVFTAPSPLGNLLVVEDAVCAVYADNILHSTG